jgi:hypothetical protein
MLEVAEKMIDLPLISLPQVLRSLFSSRSQDFEIKHVSRQNNVIKNAGFDSHHRISKSSKPKQGK